MAKRSSIDYRIDESLTWVAWLRSPTRLTILVIALVALPLVFYATVHRGGSTPDNAHELADARKQIEDLNKRVTSISTELAEEKVSNQGLVAKIAQLEKDASNQSASRAEMPSWGVLILRSMPQEKTANFQPSAGAIKLTFSSPAGYQIAFGTKTRAEAQKFRRALPSDQFGRSAVVQLRAVAFDCYPEADVWRCPTSLQP